MTNGESVPETEDVKCEALPSSFKRNNYFYGKLLTVNDFQTEQKYFVNKLRLMNRLIHGAGVVCGLRVLHGTEVADGALSDSQVRITEGVAIDFCGREIVLPNYVDIDLKEKLQKDETARDVYVWIRYDSCGDEKVQKVLEASSCQEECCYSRIKEGYKVEADPTLPKQHGVLDGEICSQWDKFVKNPKEYEFLLRNCPDCLEDEVIVLAKVSLQRTNDGSVSVKEVDNSVDAINRRRLVYGNDRLYSLVECLRKKIEELSEKIVEPDLPNIVNVSWEHDGLFLKVDDWVKHANADFTITFDEKHPIDKDTLNSNTLSITLERTSHEFEIEKAVAEVPPSTSPKEAIAVKPVKKALAAVTRVAVAEPETPPALVETEKMRRVLKLERLEIPVSIKSASEKAVVFSKAPMHRDVEKYFTQSDLQAQVKEGLKFKLRLIIKLRGDFVMTKADLAMKTGEKQKCLDGNFLRGQLPTGDGCEGGLFESWFSFDVQETGEDLGDLEICQKLAKDLKEAGINPQELAKKLKDMGIRLLDLLKLDPSTLAKKLREMKIKNPAEIASDLIQCAKTIEDYRKLGDTDRDLLKKLNAEGIDSLRKLSEYTVAGLAPKLGVSEKITLALIDKAKKQTQPK